MRYNYIYLNTCYLENGKLDPNEYNAICLRDVESVDGVQVIQTPLDYSSVVIRRAFNLTRLIDKKTHMNLTRLWFPFLLKSKFDDDKPLCFVVSSYNLPISYFEYLRTVYPDCCIVKVYRDLIKVISSINPEYHPNNAAKYFDLLMSFDKNDAEVYGLEYFDEIESKIDVEIDVDYPLCDVFLAAKAKDRLSKILKAYDILSASGLKCDFYLTGVSSINQVPKPGITYANMNMPYLEMLHRSVNCKCMIDFNQGGAIGYTSRFLEAVMYNKKLITDNPFVKASKYYNPKYIQVIERVEDIDPSFVTEEIDGIDYAYKDDYSPVNLIYKIEDLLLNECKNHF